ncbi:MAG TPA: phosphoglycerate kinase [Patescibacteria group bacterium]|nr:phosphoglycerate kinase [Patescibacteria group bacterium]
MKIKSLKEIDVLKDKKVFLRLDLNVPLKNNKVVDDYKIRAVLETIEVLLSQKASLIIATHLGKPGGRTNPDLSVRPIAKHLAKLLGKKIKFIPEVVGTLVSKASKNLKSGEIIFIENLRFKKDELENGDAFAKKLAALADIYVNDALAVCHRKQASVSAIYKYLPVYGGLLLEKELKAYEKILKPKKPLVVVMGGVKIETKAPLIDKLYSSASYILLGGGLANCYLKFNKFEIGNSMCDKDSLALIKKILKGQKNSKKLILPTDVVVEEKGGKVRSKKVADILKNDTIFDIGPDTISVYAKYIKKAQTLVWNGPMGKFEDKKYRAGTMAIARLIASRSSGRAYGLVGGGETVSALRQSNMMEYVDWVSTAGGAMLSYLSHEDMPGLKKIVS